MHISIMDRSTVPFQLGSPITGPTNCGKMYWTN